MEECERNCENWKRLNLTIEYGIFGEQFQISTNQMREDSALTILIGSNLGPFPKNTVLNCLNNWNLQLIYTWLGSELLVGLRKTLKGVEMRV